MGSEYKRIILLKGLELINDYQFSIVKSLLAHDLGLTTNMQEEYNKVKIADLMEKKFPGAACVDKLIDLFKDMPPLNDIVKQLRNEKMKVAKKMKTTEETPKKKAQQARVGPSACAPTTSSALLCERAEGTTASQKRKTAAKGTAATKKNKGIQPQTQAVCRPGAGTSAAVGFLPRPQTASSAPPFCAFPEKKVNRKTTVYEIQDNTGTMEVVGTERWHNIRCEKGDKLRLFCFQLKTIDQKLKLTCGTHSFIQVIKARKSKKEPVGFDLKVEFDMMHSPPDQFMGFPSGIVKTEDFY
nr:myeloid cell nuclear differentiation antigen isoform X2 [Neomonachus schauinslandi]